MKKSTLKKIIREIIQETGKCPETGCVKKVGDKWRVISNKTGKLWPAKYNSKKDAEDAIAAYHANKS